VVRRVAFAVPGDLSTPTGGYAYDRRMIAELEKSGWTVDVVGLGDGYPRPDNDTRTATLQRLMAVREGQPIVIDGLAFGVLPDIAAQLRRRNPLIALVHHPLALETGLDAEEAAALHSSEKAALAAAAHVVTTSAATARTVVADYDVAVDRITVAPPGTDPVAPAQGSSDGVMRLLAVGSLVPRKGYDVLIAALATLLDLRWHLTVAGDRSRDPATAKRIDDDIRRRNLADRVAVVGAVAPERIAALYAAADLFVLPSRFEGYGMVYAEALAHGLPVIGTTAGAIPETVPPAAGVLVPPEDVPALALALRGLIENPDERSRLASAARAAAGDFPTWEASAQLFSRAIEAVI
jgi:glycosyltransferase involved in cell wall biosynthesis